MNKTKNPGVLLSCFVISLLMSVPALAGDPSTGGPGAPLTERNAAAEGFHIGGVRIGFAPRIEGGVMYYEYEQDGVAGAAPLNLSSLEQVIEATNPGVDVALAGVTLSSVSSSTVRATFPTIRGGGTLFVDRFFVDAYGQHAFPQDDDDGFDSFQTLQARGSTTIGGFSFPTGAITNQQSKSAFEAELDRTEWAVSAGYGFTDHLAIYAGYREADTDFELPVSGTFEQFGLAVIEPPPALVGVIPPMGVSLSSSGNFSNHTEIEFEQQGPFVGATFGLPISAWILEGLLTFNAAVAFLDGDVTIGITNSSFTTNGVRMPLPSSVTTVSGDTVGLSLGTSWRGSTPIGGLSYLLSVDGHKYDFSGDAPRTRFDDGTENIGATGFEFDEFSISFRAGLSYVF